MKNKFDKGDLVQHVASGRRGIVIRPLKRCTVHKIELASMHVHERSCEYNREECQHVFSGEYVVEADFEKRYIVPEDMLRKDVL